MGRIVVGIDGSEGSVVALHWAIAEAKVRGALLEIVYAWEPMSPAWTGLEAMGTAVVAPVTVEELRGYAQAVLDATLTATKAELDGVEVEAHLSEGHAAVVLVETSEGADLLVVGSRGLGGFRGALMGSVSQHAVHASRIPVVVVPHLV
jgi:nucleotide-binding universal stress UspA family protein